MQQGSTATIQSNYPPYYHQYPSAPILSTSSSSSLLIPQYSSANSPQSMKSPDTSVHGSTVSPGKKPRSSNGLSSRSNDIDLRRLILINLPGDLIREYLELYLDHLSGEAEIEKIEYSNIDETTVMVKFKTELGSFLIFLNRLLIFINLFFKI